MLYILILNSFILFYLEREREIKYNSQVRMDKGSEENENCFDAIIKKSKKHVGKMGVVLSMLGGTAAVLVSLKFIVASGVIMGITNVGIFMGGIAYEKLSHENKKINEENQSLQNEKNAMIDVVRRYTVVANDPTETPTTNKSVNSNVEPVNFEQMHRNNGIQQMRSYAFPTE